MNRLWLCYQLEKKKRFVGSHVTVFFFLILFLIRYYLINYLLLSKISRYCDHSLFTVGAVLLDAHCNVISCFIRH